MGGCGGSPLGKASSAELRPGFSTFKRIQLIKWVYWREKRSHHLKAREQPTVVWLGNRWHIDMFRDEYRSAVEIDRDYIQLKRERLIENGWQEKAKHMQVNNHHISRFRLQRRVNAHDEWRGAFQHLQNCLGKKWNVCMPEEIIIEWVISNN